MYSLGKLLSLKGFRHIDFEKIGRIPNLACSHHLVDSRKNHSSNGNNSAFLASAFGNLLIFEAVVRVVEIMVPTKKVLWTSTPQQIG